MVHSLFGLTRKMTLQIISIVDISFRKFNRKFTLSDDIVVNDASLDNGMLTINLERVVPEEKKSSTH